MRLAFVAALQHLSPRQRAVLVLREVLQWKAAEVAEAIGTSTAAVNSLLQRARAQLDAVGPSEDDQLASPDSPEAQDLLACYIAAFEAYDIDKLVELFTAGGDLGDAAVRRLVSSAGDDRRAVQDALPRRKGPATCGCCRPPPMASPPPALYMLNRETGVHEEFQFHVIDVGPDGISHVVAFGDDGLFASSACPTRSKRSSGHLCHAIA